MNTFIAGPDSMEFGWLLMAWVPAVRMRAKRHDHTVIVCRPEHRYLYLDFADEFIDYSIKGKHDRWYASWHPKKENLIPLCHRRAGAKMWQPTEERCMRKARLYRRYGQKRLDTYSYGLVIHARATSRNGSGIRNWPVKRYEKVLKAFPDIPACSIGTKAHHIPGTTDMRYLDLDDLCDLLASARLMIGPSSGPMHLGELCGTPRIVWTDAEPQKILGGRPNRWRYEKYWHVFNTPVRVIDEEGWRPRAKTVVRAMEKML